MLLFIVSGYVRKALRIELEGIYLKNEEKRFI